MLSICGSTCCSECKRRDACGGCIETGGHPFGGTCVAAECIKAGGMQKFEALKAALIQEFNALGIPDLKVRELNLLNGAYVNLEYRLASGQTAKLLADDRVYLGNQIERSDSERCYGIVADKHHLLVCEYGCDGTEPEIILYKKR